MKKLKGRINNNNEGNRRQQILIEMYNLTTNCLFKQNSL